jgi:peptidoglycan/LPS O-acetylase OafA/YrhL
VAGEGQRASIRHVAALDGARGLAVAGVLLFHGGHLLGGYLGVDFFFVLSGFLITSLLLAESGRTGRVGLGGFWSRRARRLLPALVVLMIGVALYSVTIAKPSELAQIRGDAFATLAYGANWRAIYEHQSYWAIFTAPSPLNQTWSLAIEEQFYLVWPLVFAGLLAWRKRAAPAAVLITALALAAVSSVLMIVLYDPASSSRVYYGTDTRAASILFGAALAALLAMRGPARGRRARVALEVVGIAGAVALAIAWTRLNGQSARLYHGGFLMCGLAATALIAAAVHPEPGPIARVLSVRPLCALGLISYGVYLYHWPIDIVADQQRIGLRGWPLFAVQTAITLAAAIVSYHLVEQPVRRGAISSAQLRRLTPAIAIGLAVVLFATTLGARSPASAGAASYNLPLLAATVARTKASPGAERIMVVGDSVADVMAGAMKQVEVQPPIAVFDVATAGCSFPTGITSVRVHLRGGGTDVRQGYSCDPTWEAGAIRQFRHQVVVWMVSNPWQEVRYQGRWISPCSAAYSALYRRNLRQEVAKLSAGGARVVVTTTAYWRPTAVSPYAGVEDLPRLDHDTDCDNAIRHAVAAGTGARLVDLFGYTCPAGRCRAQQDGVTLRPDGLHYLGRSGPIVAKWLVDQIDRGVETAHG